MTIKVVSAKVGRDGVLHLDLPLGLGQADQEVTVTVNEARKAALTGEAWREWVKSMGGVWEWDVQRPDQGKLEERDPLV